MSGILSDIKSSLGIDPAVTEFDRDVILHLNSVLSKVYQIAGSPSGSVPQVYDDTVEWTALIDAGNETAMIKSYLYLSVRLLFDPPTTSFALSSMREQQQEFEWRIRELEHLFSPDYQLTQSQYDVLNAKIAAETLARQNSDAEMVALIDSLATASGTGLSLTGDWRLLLAANATPSSKQLSCDTGVFGTAAYLLAAKIDENGVDQTALLMDSVRIYGQQKSDHKNWVSYSVSGPAVDMGTYVKIPVTPVDSGGTISPSGWTIARLVFVTAN